MPTNTPDQQITYPADADAADNPVAFNQFVGDVEPRLVREYTTEADRAARMLALSANEISSLSAPSVGIPRVEVYDGASHVSLFTRSLYYVNRKTADQNVGPSNTVLQNLTNLAVPLPGTAGAIFQFQAVVFYNSNTTADIKFAFTIPAGATMRWGIHALATGAGGISGDMVAGSISVSGNTVAVGGAAADAMATFFGEVTMGATAGDLQMQAAQQTSDASATNVMTRSRIHAWRVL
jgi:hypothetical protein